MPVKPPEYDGFPEWAADLPKIRADGFAREPLPSGFRFEVERGPAKQRGGSDAHPWTYQCQIEADAAGIDAFWAFWGDRKGNRFAMIDPRLDEWGLFRFIVERPPKETSAAPYFAAAFVLEKVG